MNTNTGETCWTCGEEAVAVLANGKGACAVCAEAAQVAANQCRYDHERLRADDALWARLPLVGVQGAASVPYRIEIRNCEAGHSLARKVARLAA